MFVLIELKYCDSKPIQKMHLKDFLRAGRNQRASIICFHLHIEPHLSICLSVCLCLMSLSLTLSLPIYIWPFVAISLLYVSICDYQEETFTRMDLLTFSHSWGMCAHKVLYLSKDLYSHWLFEDERHFW